MSHEIFARLTLFTSCFAASVALGDAFGGRIPANESIAVQSDTVVSYEEVSRRMEDSDTQFSGSPS